MMTRPSIPSRMHICIASAIIFGFLSTTHSASAFQNATQAENAVVKVIDSDNSKSGTGFIIRTIDSRLFVLTASHVIYKCEIPRIELPTQRGRQFPARVLHRESGRDPRGLAVLEVTLPSPDRRLQVLGFAWRESVAKQTRIIGIGHPASGAPWSVIEGTVVSFDGRRIYLQGAFESGCSGGPVIRDGKVIGVISEGQGEAPQAVSALDVWSYLRGVADGFLAEAYLEGVSPAESARKRLKQVLGVQYSLASFMEHVMSGDSEVVREYLIANPQLAKVRLKSEFFTATDEDSEPAQGVTALMLASLSGHPDVVRDLIRNGAAVNATNSSEKSPLHAAASEGHVEVARLLIDEGAKLEAEDDEGYTPLAWAMLQGHADMARMLVESGASTDVSTDTADCIWEMVWDQGAASALGEGIARRIKTGAMDRKEGEDNLWDAAAHGFARACTILIEAGVPVNSVSDDGTTVLLHAIRNRSDVDENDDWYEVPAALLNAKVDVNRADDTGMTPFLLAVHLRDDRLVDLLVKGGAKTDFRNAEGKGVWDLVDYRSGDVALVKSLLAAGCDPKKPDTEGLLPIVSAIVARNAGCVRALLSGGADPMSKHPDGRSLLWLALESEESALELIQILAKARVDLAQRDRFGRNAIMVAAVSGRADCVTLLARLGVDVDAVEFVGYAPLHRVAADPKLRRAMAPLVRAGAKVDVVDSGGWTPLMWACARANEDAIRALVAAGARRDVVGKKGETARSLVDGLQVPAAEKESLLSLLTP